MFDFSWSEIGLVLIVAIVVIGPDELPAVMRTLGRIARRLQYVRYAFTQQFEDFMRENDLDDIRKQVNFEEKNFDESRSDEEEEFSPPKRASDDDA